MSIVVNKNACRRFLKRPDVSTLVVAFMWDSTPQGYRYWADLHDDLRHERPISPKRMSEAKAYISYLIGEPYKETLDEAEWE